MSDAVMLDSKAVYRTPTGRLARWVVDFEGAQHERRRLAYFNYIDGRRTTGGAFEEGFALSVANFHILRRETLT